MLVKMYTANTLLQFQILFLKWSLSKKNPAYGRNWISQCGLIVEPVTCHLSPVTCHLTTTLCRFSCYDTPRMLGDAAKGDLVINKVNKHIFLFEPPHQKKKIIFFLGTKGRTTLTSSLHLSLFRSMGGGETNIPVTDIQLIDWIGPGTDSVRN